MSIVSHSFLAEISAWPYKVSVNGKGRDFQWLLIISFISLHNSFTIIIYRCIQMYNVLLHDQYVIYFIISCSSYTASVCEYLFLWPRRHPGGVSGSMMVSNKASNVGEWEAFLGHSAKDMLGNDEAEFQLHRCSESGRMCDEWVGKGFKFID